MNVKRAIENDSFLFSILDILKEACIYFRLRLNTALLYTTYASKHYIMVSHTNTNIIHIGIKIHANA